MKKIKIKLKFNKKNNIEIKKNNILANIKKAISKLKNIKKNSFIEVNNKIKIKKLRNKTISKLIIDKNNKSRFERKKYNLKYKGINKTSFLKPTNDKKLKFNKLKERNSIFLISKFNNNNNKNKNSLNIQRKNSLKILNKNLDNIVVKNPLISNKIIKINSKENENYFKEVESYIHKKKKNPDLNSFNKEEEFYKTIFNKKIEIKITLFNNKRSFVKLLRDYNINYNDLNEINYKYNKNCISEIKFLFDNDNKIIHNFNSSQENKENLSHDNKIKFNNKIIKVIISYNKFNIYNICFIDKNEYVYDLLDLNNKHEFNYKVKNINNDNKIIGFNSYYDINDKLCKFQMILI